MGVRPAPHRISAILPYRRSHGAVRAGRHLARKEDPAQHVLVEALQRLHREPREDVAGIRPRAREELIQGHVEEGPSSNYRSCYRP